MNKKNWLFIIPFVLFYYHTALCQTNTQQYDLDQAIDYALANNPDLQIMHDRIAQAESHLGLALSAFYPQITTGLYYEHTNNPSRAFGMIIGQRRLDFSPSTDFNHPGGTDNYRPEVRLRYSLFRGGQDYYLSKAAKLGVKTAELEQIAAQNQLIQMVSATFYGHLAAIEADKVAARSIEAVESELKQSRTRYREGAELKSDVLSLEVQLAEARDKKIRTENAIALTKTAFKNLLGMASEQPFNIDPFQHWSLPIINNTHDELLQVALIERPEIKNANTQISIAEHKLKASKGAFLPRADAYVAYGSDSKNLDFNTNRDNVTAGVMVEMDVFSGFRDKEKVKHAEHQLSIAKKTLQKTQLQIENDVQTAYLKLKEALARVEVTTSSVTAASEALRLVNEQRKAGTVTVTRYIEAEVAQDKSHARHIAAQFDALIAEATLKQATGVWK